jgi:glycosyltransferase involved in cell wall biosynthesis
VIANNTSENLETIGDAGLSYDGAAGAEGLRPVLQRLIDDPGFVEEQRKLSAAHVRKYYSWDAITDLYLSLFNKLLARPPARLRLRLSSINNRSHRPAPKDD